MTNPGYIGNKDIIEGLGKVLADTFILYFKTHSFHWNVEGPQFKTLHELFEEQYTELWQATDEIAERIRALEGYAPNNYEEMTKAGNLQSVGQTPDYNEMVSMLANDNSTIVSETLYPALRTAEEAGDEATVDMMIARIAVHEKAAWMLRSINKDAA